MIGQEKRLTASAARRKHSVTAEHETPFTADTHATITPTKAPEAPTSEDANETLTTENAHERSTSADANETYEKIKKEAAPIIIHKKPQRPKAEIPFQRGDSVMIYPDKKIGIVCETANEKGILRVQLPSKKIWINHKRVKLLVAAEELYPPDYDFSIIFDTVANRKLRHQMDRRHVEGQAIVSEE